ncbi:alanine racemase [bacterium]|nr:alanine racemase [bacterium]NBW57942.1 alanine racemase [bacterium]NBX72412.1 alanine racemase [bacterium]
MSRSAIAILSTENLLHNLNVIKNHVGSAKIIAMIKANAYGHGIRTVASKLDGLVDLLGVASIDEAIALRKHGVRSPIILMQGVFESNELLLASVEHFHVVFNNFQQLEWLDKIILPRALHAWIKIDTGMGRLGFDLDQAYSVYERLMNHRSLIKPIHVMSHFSAADIIDHPLNQEQIERFKNFTMLIESSGSQLSLCNSAAIFNFPQCHYHYVRPGLALYGVSPLQGRCAEDLGLKPVMSLQTSLISVRTFKKGSLIGYGGRYSCPQDMPIGIIAFGYGDGYPITARDGTPILVNGIKCSLVGRVSMDMIAVDLRACPTAGIGDPVVLWGEDLPIEHITPFTSNISWDILTGVQHRVKFLWTRI